jgi:protein TonB
MKRHGSAFSLSLAIHAILFLIIFGAGTYLSAANKPIPITFDLGDSGYLKDEMAAPAKAQSKSTSQKKKEIKPEEKQVIESVRKVEPIPTPLPVQTVAVQEMPSAVAMNVPSGKAPSDSAPKEGLSTSGSAGNAGVVGGHGEGAGEQGRNRYLKEHLDYIRDRFMGNLEFPERARRMNWEGKVFISFVINTDGRVESVLVLRSSGYSVLDRSAVDAVKRSVPFPKPPYASQIRFPITFNLN